MKLSKETLSYIKNYAAINPNILLKPGKRLTTKEPTNKIFSLVSIVEDFPMEFPIYDLNEFLSVYSLFDNPELEFSPKYITMKEGAASLKFFAAAIENLTLPPDKEIVFTDIVVEFDMPSTMLSTILKTAPVLKVQDISIVGDGSTVSIVIADKKNPTSNSYAVTVGTTTKVFKVNVSTTNMKMLNGDYAVKINQKGIQFQSKSTDLVYYVAMELDSKFEVEPVPSLNN